MNPPPEWQPDIPDLAEALTELTGLMLATPSLTSLLEDVARLATTVVTPPAACGITLAQDDLPLTVASSDPLAAQVDEVQYGIDQGPCLQALRTGQAVLVPDLASEHRWGSYPAHALTYGVHSSLSLPLVVNDDSRGALNLYAGTRDAFGTSEQLRAEVFAAQAATALTVVNRQIQQVQLTDQLREALASRAVIDQAIGILMAQQGCDHNTAYGLLRTSSQNQNRKLRKIAAQIVTAVSGHEPSTPPFNDPT
jgi:GAF domain-containing protein